MDEGAGASKHFGVSLSPGCHSHRMRAAVRNLNNTYQIPLRTKCGTESQAEVCSRYKQQSREEE